MKSKESEILMVPLGEVAEITAGQSPPSKYYNQDGIGLPFYQGKTDFGERHPSPRVWCSKPSKIAEKNDILFCVRAPVGPTNIATEKTCIGRGLGTIRPKKYLYGIYLLHYLRDREPYFSNIGNGSTFKAITRSELSTFEIPLPPLAAQRRIAAILDKADALRRKRAQALQLTDQFLQSLFLDMFGDPVTNPKGWEKVTLKEVVDVIDCPHSTPKWKEEGVLALRTSNLGAGRWIWDDTRYVSEGEYKERSKRAELNAGDIILSREGTVGIAAIVPENTRMCMGQRLVQLRIKPRKTTSRYLFHLLLMELTPERISRVMAGSTSKHLNVGDLRKLEIPCPTHDFQQVFADAAKKLSDSRRQQEIISEQQENLFSSLTQLAFQGEL